MQDLHGHERSLQQAVTAEQQAGGNTCDTAECRDGLLVFFTANVGVRRHCTIRRWSHACSVLGLHHMPGPAKLSDTYHSEETERTAALASMLLQPVLECSPGVQL